MANGAPQVGEARIGVFDSNDANARSENITIAKLGQVLNVVHASLNTPPSSNQGIRSAIAGIIGQQWKDEPDDWYLVTLLTHGFEWSQAERAKVVELFGG